MKKLTLYLACLATLALFSVPASAGEPVNSKCPVSGKDVDADKTVDYTAEFCCGKCVKKFNADPLAYVEKVAAAEDGKCPFSGKDIDEDANATVAIGVCCGKCEKKVSAEPGKYFAKLEEE